MTTSQPLGRAWDDCGLLAAIKRRSPEKRRISKGLGCGHEAVGKGHKVAEALGVYNSDTL